MRVVTLCTPALAASVCFPLLNSSISAGFPSPADDYTDKTLDLSEYLINHPAATFFMRVEGHSMTEAGIRHGSLLIVDRSITPVDGSIVVAVLDGGFTVKRLCLKGTTPFLMAANPDFAPIEITVDRDFEIWGVVIHAIHSF